MARAVGVFLVVFCLSPLIFSTDSAAYQQATVYVCPMHPEVQSSKPGKCPKCEMKLVAKPATGAAKDTPKNDAPASAQTTANNSASADMYTCSMHPEIRVSKPGKCPKCGMTLVPVIPAISDDFNLKLEC